jgi:S-adenosyl-L-methionine hydrolase (adenosine-forming)
LPRKQFVTLTTDFGLQDHFIGVIKAVILNINPEAILVDINHNVSSYDVFDAAFTLVQSYRFFPSDTIHLVVVDPGVGTARRPILARSMDHKFVAPDNGVLSLIYEREENVEVRHVTADHYFLNPVSNTFHGRDIFAPVVGWLSKGVEVDKFGDPITDFAKFNPPKPKRVSDSLVKGVTIKVDKFGNLITNLMPEDVPQLFSDNPPPFKIIINQQEITKLNLAYSMGKPSEIFAMVGSSGYLEICTNRGSAAKALNAGRGAEVGVMFGGADVATPQP